MQLQNFTFLVAQPACISELCIVKDSDGSAKKSIMTGSVQCCFDPRRPQEEDQQHTIRLNNYLVVSDPAVAQINHAVTADTSRRQQCLLETKNKENWGCTKPVHMQQC